MTKTTEPDFLHPVVVNDEETVLRIHGTLQMRSVRNGQIPDSIALQDILTDEHDNIGTHRAILDEGRPMVAASTVDKVLSSPDSEGLDGYEEFVKDPIASLTKCV
jgi:hypothetical protein